MFFPEAMTELELIIPEKDLLPVTKALAGQGILHQVDASYLSSDDASKSVGTWKEQAAAYSALERQILFIMQSLAVEEGSPSSIDEDTMVELETVRPLVEQIERDVKDTNDQLIDKQNELEQLRNHILQLEPIVEIDLDISLLRNQQYIHSILGTVPVVNLERLETSLARIPYALMTLRREREDAVVLLTGARFNADILDRAARSAYLNPLELSGTHEGTPAEIIQSLRREIEDTQKEIEKQKSIVVQLHNTYEKQLQTMLWQVRGSKLLSDAMARFGKLHYTYLIVGWVPTSKLEALTQQLKQISKNIVIEATPTQRRGSMTQGVPVALENNGMFGAFQTLVTTYARPRYEEIDPTVLMTITFPLLFGAMFGDVGHGLLLVLIGWLLR